MKRAIFVPSITIVTLVILLLPDALFAEPRTQTVNLSCGTQLQHNRTIYSLNFVATMDNISDQVRTSGFGIAVTGSGPDVNYGLAQCYGDLSIVDCVLCFFEARNVIAKCHPWNGGMVYLDGCFTRGENYNFFQEYIGQKDHAVCGNITRNDSNFRESTRRALSQAVLAAPNNNGYARAASRPSYVLANCWRTLNASSCRACLENASASISGCLPSSEGRVLNTGCFMRYSDTDFLNPIPGNGNSRDLTTMLVVQLVLAHYFYCGAVSDCRLLSITSIRRAFYIEAGPSSLLEPISLSYSPGGVIRGYMAPEYLAHGRLTEKADVYSFGVLVLEIVTGRENNTSKTIEYEDSLVATAWMHFQQRTVEELFDPNLMLHKYHNNNVKNEILRVVHVGLLCTQENPSLRPSMSKVLEMLVKKEQLPEPTRPPFMDEFTTELNDTSENPLWPLEHASATSVDVSSPFPKAICTDAILKQFPFFQTIIFDNYETRIQIKMLGGLCSGGVLAGACVDLGRGSRSGVGRRQRLVGYGWKEAELRKKMIHFF
ncbi:hypothetical protein BUALT_Bualt05G0160200 [Buddleja alternifolia]|uniref:Gnk2-homologous domain-containing protein n=1 Tax=Buddleja alternifolia TaxID=168488 RepID=A0AAV6XJS9_9LAMI|nr:hypothetical protein BUALT_Bualt05G0160200 [Buddleja alternifolia]